MLRKSLASHQLKTALIMAALFALSVGIRMPFMDRPLGENFDVLTAHTLLIQQIWQENGALKHKFLPIKTYNNPGDKNISNSARIKDRKGNYYYVSYGPLAPIVPYLIFKALHVYPDIKPIQIFGLCVHFLCCFFVYLIVSALTRKEWRGRVNIAALMGFAVYLFSPFGLWYHSNVYSSEIFVQVFFIAGVYVFLRLMTSPQKGIYYAMLGLSVFLMILTEWLGAFFSLTLLIYCLFNLRKRSMRIVFWTVSLSSLMALAFILWHYSKIDGIQSLIQVWTNKSLASAGIVATGENRMSLWKLETWLANGKHYFDGYGYFLINLFYFFLIKHCFLEKVRSEKLERIMLGLCFWPAVMHQLIFSNFTAVHGYSVLKAGFFIALLTALMYSKIDRYLSLKWGPGFSRILRSRGLLICFCLITLFSINCYFEDHKNRPINIEVIGKEIAKIADKDEVIFLRRDPWNRSVLSQVVFYARRNIARWRNNQAAQRFLRQHGNRRGVILAFDGQGRLVREKHISVNAGGE